MVKVNRTQALVLGFFLVVWISLLAILMVAPEVYDQALSLPGDGGAAEITELWSKPVDEPLA
jgi:predicted PurR-regulated permease PerM